MFFVRLFLIFAFALLSSGCFFETEEKRKSITMGLSPKGMFNLANTTLEGGALDESIKIFEQLQAAYPGSKYALQS